MMKGCYIEYPILQIFLGDGLIYYDKLNCNLYDPCANCKSIQGLRNMELEDKMEPYTPS